MLTVRIPVLNPGDHFVMRQHVGSEVKASLVRFIGFSEKHTYLVFEDMELFYWGHIAVKDIRFAIPAHCFPGYTYRSFGIDIECTFGKT